MLAGFELIAQRRWEGMSRCPHIEVDRDLNQQPESFREIIHDEESNKKASS